MNGIVTDINTFSLQDGPGIRTTVFLKGCPLRCLWCHNPENLCARPQFSRLESTCIRCGRCASACPMHIPKESGEADRAERCTGCGACSTVCPTGARTILGKTMTVEQVCTAVLRDRLFFAHSGGGVTLSGGEPMMQPDFSLSVLRFLKSAGIHTALETCGHFDEQWIVPLLECTDLFLFDYKETDPLLHKQWTSVLPTRILHTLHRLSSSGANIILRCPIIPTLNDRADHFAGIAHAAQSLHLAQVELMPYHSIGLDKAKQIGFEQRKDIPLPTENDKQQWLRAVKDNGFQHVTVSR